MKRIRDAVEVHNIVKYVDVNKSFDKVYKIMQKRFPAHHWAHVKVWNAFWYLMYAVNKGLEE